ncbi:hypothetical protein B0T16DRAFT_493763 [Cercophora newfieldiana]|uniref:Uncharacterized protein n=1 Tax=Cercophora newfieldiana TaxID=92897 RepID=A0AA39Y6I7_9PEZI|nr:hypothetical protein B0T16DRAFT_493763 [Cercophora newfieldiana]
MSGSYIPPQRRPGYTPAGNGTSSRFGSGNAGGSRFGAAAGAGASSRLGFGAGATGRSRAQGVWRSGACSGAAPAVLTDPSDGDHNRFYVGTHRVYSGGTRVPNHSDGRQPVPALTQGSGTVQDPQVVWLYAPDRDKWSIEHASARTAAREAGVKCIVLRCGLHNQTAVREANTLRMVTVQLMNGSIQRRLDTCDWHVTVFLGDGMSNVQLQGHIFLYPAGHHQGYELVTDPADRRFARSRDPKDSLYYEYWMRPGVQIRNVRTGAVSRHIYVAPR